MGPLTQVDIASYWEVLILDQIMGITHYLFIAHQECENAYRPLACKMLSVTPCEYMDSERHAYLKTSGSHKFCKVYQPHPSFSSK